MKYKGKAPVKFRDKVDLLVDGSAYEQAHVRDVLAAQFTVAKKGRLRFFFYADKGLTWRHSNV
jgi:hypothetical protein